MNPIDQVNADLEAAERVLEKHWGVRQHDALDWHHEDGEYRGADGRPDPQERVFRHFQAELVLTTARLIAEERRHQGKAALQEVRLGAK